MFFQGNIKGALYVFCTYIIPILGLVTLLIGVYEFHQKNVSQKIKLLSFSHESSIWNGEKITIRIENCTKHIIEICRIHIVSNSCIFCLYDGDPVLLGAHRTKDIDSGYLSEGPKEILDGIQKGSFAIVSFANGIVVKSRFGKKSRKVPADWISKNRYKYQNIPSCKTQYNGRIIPIGVKYIANIFDKDNKMIWESLLTSSGFMENSLFGYNQLSFEEENVINCESIKKALIGLTEQKYTVIVNEILHS